MDLADAVEELRGLVIPYPETLKIVLDELARLQDAEKQRHETEDEDLDFDLPDYRRRIAAAHQEAKPISNPWMQTYTGKAFVLDPPDPMLVDIYDIAKALSCLARYNGHTNESPVYSVAQHSVLVARHLPPILQLYGLMHDAAEAYLGDLANPVKELVPEFKRLEYTVQGAIHERFNLEWPLPEEWAREIKRVDLAALITEKRDLFASQLRWKVDELGIEPWNEPVFVWSQREAKIKFLEMFAELTVVPDFADRPYGVIGWRPWN